MASTGSLTELFLLKGENGDVRQIFFQLIPSIYRCQKFCFCKQGQGQQ